MGFENNTTVPMFTRTRRAAQPTETPRVSSPTLLIGVGGTGTEVVCKVKRRIRSHLSERDRSVQFLVIDTDSRSSERLAADEFVGASGFDGDRLIAELPHDHPIRDWWPERNGQQYRIGRPIKGGARQVRAVGRLAFFKEAGVIRNLMASKIATSTDLEIRGRQASHHDRGANIYVIGSLAGGTGSGMYLDAAYLARKVAEEAGLDPVVTGMLVFPRAFLAKLQGLLDQITRTQANTYAALKELEFFTAEEEWYCDYNSVLSVEQMRRPFDVCYLLDTLNERSVQVTGIERLTDVIAEQVFLEVAATFGGEAESARANMVHDESTHSQTSDGRPTAFNSFGVSSLATPASEMADYAACQCVTALLRQPEAESTSGASERAARDFIDRHQLVTSKDRCDLPDHLEKGVERPEAPTVNSFHERMSRKQLLSSAEDWTRTTTGELQRFREEVQRAGKRTFREAVAELKKASLNYFNRTEEGVRFDHWLRSVERLLDRSRGHARQFQQQLNTEANNHESACKSKFNQLQEARSRFRAKQNLQALVPGFVSEFEQHLDRRCKAIRYEESAKVYDKLLGEVRERLRKLRGSVGTFDLLVKDFEDHARSLLAACDQLVYNEGGYLLSASSLNREQFERLASELIEEHQDGLESEVHERCGPRSSWSRGDGHLGERLLAVACEYFGARVQRDLLKQMYQDLHMTAEEVLEKLHEVISRCSPFWNYREERIHDLGQRPMIALAGVVDKNRKDWTDLQQRMTFPQVMKSPTFVTTGNPSAIIFTCMRNGLPLKALGALEEFERAYRQTDSRPLHIHRGWHQFPDLLPGRELKTRHKRRGTSDENGAQGKSETSAGTSEGETEPVEALRLFSVTLALGIIYEHASTFYCRQADSGRESDEDDRELGGNLIRAFDQFAEDRQLQAEAKRAVEGLLRGDRAEIDQQLSGFLAKLKERISDPSAADSVDMLNAVHDIVDAYLHGDSAS